MPQIIDAHSHYMPPAVAQKTAFFKVAWSDIDRQLTLMDECGISKALLLYPTSDAHIQMGGWDQLCDAYNPAIAQIVQTRGDRFIGAGIIPADRPDQFEQELRRIKNLGLKVISMASSYDGIYLDDKRFTAVFEFARKNKMPIHVHPQIMNPIGEERLKDPLLTPVLEYVFDVSACIGKMMMAGIFTNYPEVNFIFAHYGGVLPFVKERFDNTYLMLRKRDFVKDLKKLPSDYFHNLYYDISGTKSKGAMQCALEVTDPSHILFGSDFPANQSIQQTIAVIEDAPISDQHKAEIMQNDLLGRL